ncbi:MAG: tetratricopeptide repeat protein, partial [Woeseiaceae bacterium]
APTIQASFDDNLPYLRLRNYLKMRAREQDDFDEMIRLEKLTAVTTVDFESIAQLYLQKGEPETAAHWLSKADALDKHDRTGRKSLWASVHAATGDWEAAIVAQEAAFQYNASYDEYRELIKLAERAGRSADVRKSVLRFLCSQDQALSWSDERRAWTLVRILKDNQDWDALKETALARISEADRLLQAARWIAEFSLADAGPVYEKTVDAMVAKKTNRSYRAAVRALLEARSVFDAAGATAFDECLSRLRETHYRKRNFMAALEEGIGAS